MRLRSQAKKKVEDSSFSSHFPWFLAESPFLWILQQGLNVFNLSSLQLVSDVVENRHVLVVYHLHGQTGRCTVWANHGKQNLGLISSIFVHFRISLTICTNRYLPTNGREGLKTGIKDSFEETEHEVPLLQEIFRRNDAKRCVTFTF